MSQRTITVDGEDIIILEHEGDADLIMARAGRLGLPGDRLFELRGGKRRLVCGTIKLHDGQAFVTIDGDGDPA